MIVNDGSVKLNLIRNKDVFYTKFKNNGNTSLNIDGSAIQKVFTLEDLTNDNFVLTRIDYIIATDEAIDVIKFGNVPALVNGIEFNVDGSQTFKTNSDVMLFGTDNSIHSAKVEGVLTSVINGSWDVKDVFNNGLICKKSDLTVTVRDDLSSITLFELTASGIKLD